MFLLGAGFCRAAAQIHLKQSSKVLWFVLLFYVQQFGLGPSVQFKPTVGPGFLKRGFIITEWFS